MLCYQTEERQMGYVSALGEEECYGQANIVDGGLGRRSWLLGE